MIRTIAIASFALLAVGSGAQAGKLSAGGMVQHHPTSIMGTSSECGIAPHKPGPWPRCGVTTPTSTPTQPHGGCGYYGPNGVLIRCE